jgi:hypothetical protein
VRLDLLHRLPALVLPALSAAMGGGRQCVSMCGIKRTVDATNNKDCSNKHRATQNGKSLEYRFESLESERLRL